MQPLLALSRRSPPSTIYTGQWPSQSSCSTISPAKKEDLEAMAGALNPEVRVSNFHGLGIQRQPRRPHPAQILQARVRSAADGGPLHNIFILAIATVAAMCVCLRGSLLGGNHWGHFYPGTPDSLPLNTQWRVHGRHMRSNRCNSPGFNPIIRHRLLPKL